MAIGCRGPSAALPTAVEMIGCPQIQVICAGSMIPLTRRLGRTLRGLALSLSALALCVQMVASACLAGPMAPPGTHSVIICSASGTQVVQVDADGQPLPDTPHHQVDSDCMMCMGVHAAAPPLAALSVSFVWQKDIPAWHTTRLAVAPRYFSYLTRGPPAGFAGFIG